MTALEHLATIMTVALPLVALALWLVPGSPMVAFLLWRSRNRTIGRALRDAGVPSHTVRRMVRLRTRAVITDGRPTDTAGELTWLDSCLSPSKSVLTHGLGPHDDGRDRTQDLRALASSYRELAGRLRSRSMLGGGSAPMVEHVAATSVSIAQLLTVHAGTTVATPFTTGWQTAGDRDLRLTLFGREIGDIGVPQVTAVPRMRRWVIDDHPSLTHAHYDGVVPLVLPTTRQERTALTAKLQGRHFDGVLPSLLDFAVLDDSFSGHSHLVLILQQTSFSAVMASHYVGDRGVGRPPEQVTGDTQLLTLSCTPITAEQLIVAVRRSDTVSVGRGQWAPGVSGNMEMRSRTGLAADLDAHGFPDVEDAILREAQEELALSMSTEAISHSGLLAFNAPHERHTHVLLTQAQVDVSFEQLVSQAADADKLEGHWELEGDMLGIPVPRTHAQHRELAIWTMQQPDHAPHLTGCLLAMTVPVLVRAALATDDAVPASHALQVVTHDLQEAMAGPPVTPHGLVHARRPGTG